MIEDAKGFLARFEPSTMTDLSELQSVMDIVQTVRQDGDAALRRYSERFDGVAPDPLELSADTLQAAYEGLEPALQDALHLAIRNIEAYQRTIKWQDGVPGELYQKVHPLRKVGIYVPGGKAAYPSSVLHSAVLANVAGVEETVVVTPPQKDGAVNQAVLAACYLCDVKHVYQVGGAQAVAALAYGTETVPKVDKIVGPGNHYVALAKKLVYGDVGIDSIAGPSEIVLIIDEHANPEWVALDVLAQAEHDERARTFVLSTSRTALEAVEAALERKAPKQKRSAIIAESLAQHHYVVLTADRAETIQVANVISGEHVSVQTEDAASYVGDLTTAGALFVGSYSPEAIGDYTAGPSHVLPTSGNARFANGLSVNDFLRTNSVIQLAPETFLANAEAAETLAAEEALDAHRQSVAERRKGLTHA